MDKRREMVATFKGRKKGETGWVREQGLVTFIKSWSVGLNYGQSKPYTDLTLSDSATKYQLTVCWVN